MKAAIRDAIGVSKLITMANGDDNALGNYLKDRRARLDPAAYGFSTVRRRTPGLRREEVAQRAHVSATWYTWLEQGRGGTPSAEVLDGIAGALALTAAEREHLFLLAQHRPPQAHYEAPESISPQLQRVLDSMEFSPAYVKTAAWDIVAWNRAAAAVLTDYSVIAPHERNILRMMFRDSHNKVGIDDWNVHARFAVAAFRIDVARAGASESIAALVDELCQSSPEFREIWSEQHVGSYGEGIKHFHRLETGPLSLEYSSFVVDGRPDLGLVIFTPATPADAERVKALVCARGI